MFTDLCFMTHLPRVALYACCSFHAAIFATTVAWIQDSWAECKFDKVGMCQSEARYIATSRSYLPCRVTSVSQHRKHRNKNCVDHIILDTAPSQICMRHNSAAMLPHVSRAGTERFRRTCQERAVQVLRPRNPPTDSRKAATPRPAAAGSPQPAGCACQNFACRGDLPLWWDSQQRTTCLSVVFLLQQQLRAAGLRATSLLHGWLQSGGGTAACLPHLTAACHTQPSPCRGVLLRACIRACLCSF